MPVTTNRHATNSSAHLQQEQGNVKIYESLAEYFQQKVSGQPAEWTDLYFCDFEGWQFVLAPRPDEEDSFFDVRLQAPLLDRLLDRTISYTNIEMVCSKMF